MVGRREIQTRAAGLEREHHDGRAAFTLECLDHGVAPGFRHSAVEKRNFGGEPVGQVRHHQFAELTKLCEQQNLLVVADDRLDDVLDQSELSRTVLPAAHHRRTVAQEVRGMIAHLFEFGQRRQDGALALHPFRPLDLRHHLVHHGAVQRGLLFAEIRSNRHLQLLREIRDHGGIGLHAPQHKGGRDGSQSRDGKLIFFPLDRHDKPFAEHLLRAEYTAIGKIED